MIPRIGKFETLRRLGEGAMGEVFLASDPVIGREVAIKTIRKDSVALGEAKEEARERFYREARAAGGLNHPNLVTVHEFGEDQGLLYLAMEYVPGEDLSTLLSRRSLTPRELLEVLAQVCDGLAYAHSKGVLHRDIKPTNIRVARLQGRLIAKVMDFGIARIGGSDMTGTGTLLGTFGYMAPEYIQSGIPAPSADLFAVGVILYEALAGRRPFSGDTTATVLYRIVHENPAPLDLTNLPEVSPSLQGIVMRSLSKSPAERFTSAESLGSALRKAIDPAWSGPTDAAATERAPRPLPLPSAPTAGRSAGIGNGRIWVATAAAAALVACGVWAWNWYPTGPTPAASSPGAAAAAAVPPVTVPNEPTTPNSLPVSPVATVASTPNQRPESRPVPGPTPPVAVAAAVPIPVAPSILEARTQGEDVPPTGFDQGPRGMLQFAESTLANDPAQHKAHALRIVALYDLGRYPEMAKALRASMATGVRPRALLRFPRFAQMVRQEQAEHRLPEPVRAELMELQLPGQPGEPGPMRRKFRLRN